MNKEDVIVRLEEEKDYRIVEKITRDAFNYPDRIKRGQIGCPYEHWMVHELRHRDGILELSLVAQLKDGTIVGHIICSKAIVKIENRKLFVLDLGPLSRTARISASRHWQSSYSGNDRESKKT